MGNCIDLQKPVTWVDDDDDDDDDWASAKHRSSRHCQKNKADVEEKGGAGSTEIRIKISKKQLEELLRQVDGKGVPLRQVLADLASMDESGKLHDQERHWRPKLQSIPEVPE